MKSYLTNLAGDDVAGLLRDLRDIGENFLMAGPVSRPGLTGRGSTELYRDLVTLRGGVGGVWLVARHTGTFPGSLTPGLCPLTLLTVQLHGVVAVLQGLVVRLLAEDDVAVLGVDIIADLRPGGAELGDVGVVTDVDGAVSAAQQFLPLHSLHRLVGPHALQARLLVQNC